MIDDIKTVCEKIWALESRHNLFSVQIQGITIWPLMRMSMYYEICMRIGIFSQPHSERISTRDALAFAVNGLRAPFRSPLRDETPKKYLVFDHPRKVKVNDAYIDIYTDALLRTLPPQETEVYENWHNGHHLMPLEGNRRHLDDLATGALLAQCSFITFTRDEKQFIAQLEMDMTATFGCAFPLKKRIAKEIRHHRYCIGYFTKLLTIKQPTRVFLVVSYAWYKRALIAAAKMQGIETVELQHGTFSPYHLGYNFPDVPTPVDCFPDRFYSFGDYWNKLARLPIDNSRIASFGFAHFHNQRQKVIQTTRSPNRVLFVSQGVIGRPLSRLCAALARDLPEYHITYKLHPGEYDLWKTNYSSLVQAASLPNLDVIDDGSIDLYTLFASSTYLVGVFSTALYEGLALGCKTFVADLPGVEYMDGLIHNHMVIKINSTADIIRHIHDNTPLAPFDTDDIFKRPSTN